MVREQAPAEMRSWDFIRVSRFFAHKYFDFLENHKNKLKIYINLLLQIKQYIFFFRKFLSIIIITIFNF